MKKLSAAFAAVLLVAALAAAAPDKLSEARKYIDRGMHRTAAALLADVTEKDPDNAKAFALLAETRIASGDAFGAESAAARAVDLAEDSAEYWRIWGRACFEQGIAAVAAQEPGNAIKSFFADAEMKYFHLLKLAPEDPEARCWAGWAKEWQEYPNEARKLYEEQIAKFPKAIGGYRRLGHMVSMEANGLDGGQTPEAQAKRAEALKIFEDGLSKAGEDAETLYAYGIALEWARRKDDALKAYWRAIDADPEYFKAWDRLRGLKVPGDQLLAAAEKHLQKDRLAATPAMWAGYQILSSGEDVAKCAARALALMLPALEEHGEHGGLWTQAMSAAMKLLAVKADEGLAALRKIHEVCPLSGDAANNMGLYFRDTGKYKDSLEWYLKAAERAPESQGILNDTALIYLFHFPAQAKQALPLLERTIALVQDGDQMPETGYWDALENLCKYYWEVDRQPEQVIRYAEMRYESTKGVEPYNRSPQAAHYAELAKKALGK
jgi:tetratricopeptide (TPR) repeat protein